MSRIPLIQERYGEEYAQTIEAPVRQVFEEASVRFNQTYTEPLNIAWNGIMAVLAANRPTYKAGADRPFKASWAFMHSAAYGQDIEQQLIEIDVFQGSIVPGYAHLRRAAGILEYHTGDMIETRHAVLGIEPKKVGSLFRPRYEVDLSEVNKRLLSKLLPSEEITIAKSTRLAGDPEYRQGRLARQEKHRQYGKKVVPAIYRSPAKEIPQPLQYDSFANGRRQGVAEFTVAAATARVTEHDAYTASSLSDYCEDIYDIHSLLETALPQPIK